MVNDILYNIFVQYSCIDRVQYIRFSILCQYSLNNLNIQYNILVLITKYIYRGKVIKSVRKQGRNTEKSTKYAIRSLNNGNFSRKMTFFEHILRGVLQLPPYYSTSQYSEQYTGGPCQSVPWLLVYYLDYARLLRSMS